MIKSFAHKGLEDFFYDGTKKGIQPTQAKRLTMILDRLDAAAAVTDMDFPGSFFHELKGNRRGTYSVRVTGNWRITFKFAKGQATDVKFEDYHR